MTLKKYQKIKLIIVVVLSLLISQSLILKNFLIPAFAVVSASLILMLLRRQVTEVLADERDHASTGKSASLAIQIYSWFAVIAMFVLYVFRDLNPAYEPIAITLAYSTCFLMIVYSVVLKFQNKVKFTKNNYL
jgi:uncharacterized membrane protein